MFKVLVVDDDKELLSAVKELLERKKYEVITASSGKEALDIYTDSPDISVALVDLVMPMMDGFTLIDGLKEISDDIDVIIITGQGTVPTAVEAMKKGAKDFIIKPFDKDILINKLETLRRAHELENKVTELKKLISDKYGFEEIISRSPIMKTVFEKASSAANSDANVFVVGETGTGKGLLAKAIHLKSKRKDQPFVAINCGSIPKELLESELFGHKKGSFTGAIRDNQGLFVSAKQGTVFLDEIGEMPKDLQVRMLRVLEEHKVRPVGGTEEVKVDARVIAATNRSIEELKDTCLREDLFFRLAVIVIELPPLRDRKDDLPLLMDYFINKFNDKYGKNIGGLTEKALTLLHNYNFPGNIREMENVIEGIIAVSDLDKERISEKDIRSHLLWRDSESSKYTLLSLDKLEKFAIDQALKKSKGNKSKAAEILGISRDTLYRKLKQFGVE